MGYKSRGNWGVCISLCGCGKVKKNGVCKDCEEKDEAEQAQKNIREDEVN